MISNIFDNYLSKVDKFTQKSFNQLIENNFSKNLNYIITVVEDAKNQVSLYDGCTFAKIQLELGAEAKYNPETAEKMAKIYYCCVNQYCSTNQTQLYYPNYVGRQEDLKEIACKAYIFANDSSLNPSKRAEYQFDLGHCFYQGKGTEQNFAQAFNCYQKAGLEGNYPPALFMVGHCLERGEGVPKDEETALQWYLKAASYSDEVDIVRHVAQKFEEKGQIEIAHLLYQKAAQNHDPVAIDYLIKFYEQKGEEQYQEAINKWKSQLAKVV
ncbi:TPR repeat-containing protein [Neochlamydia sp. EPS4]|uniref:tetratricopeptide repeat protein n=1 Tax=Neochlamydia sp. EPS4 TaxID=1478175 RepID=UPI0005826AD1|nr:tetratricopeptide repeat protein [Neochlamydia sp. EPS4]KIC76085.1 TPR repeat-containing protein [Neochlamydia sp. EPS4]